MPVNKNHPPRENIAIVPDDAVLTGMQYNHNEDGESDDPRISPTWGTARADITAELKDMADALAYAAHLTEEDQHFPGAINITQAAAMHIADFILPMLESMHSYEHMNDRVNSEMDGLIMPDTLAELERLMRNVAPSQRH